MMKEAMVPSRHDIDELVATVWDTTLGLPIQPNSDAAAVAWTPPCVEAQVHITGTWRGVVVLHASESLAKRVARRLFGGDAPPEAADVQDAVGELANITGGNIKGLLSAEDAHLSLPAVVYGRDYRVHIPGSEPLGRFEFLSDGDPFVVTLLRASDEEAG